jgi:hypothetical protein
MCQHVAFSHSAGPLTEFIPRFRLIACRECGGYIHGGIQVNDVEYAYYDESCQRVFFLGEDWDDGRSDSVYSLFDVSGFKASFGRN